MSHWPRVAIMGGSIGGLTAALVLRDLGCEVDVYERSTTALEARGAGIGLHPMTIRYFTIKPYPGTSSASMTRLTRSMGI